MNPLLILNPNSYNSVKVRSYLERKRINYFINGKDGHSCIKEFIKEGQKDFIIGGGDGTVNQFINELMQFSPNKRKNLRIGILPCGKANDLAGFMGIKYTEGFFHKTHQKIERKIDVIQVNNYYFVTGGGIGLPAEVISDILDIKRSKRMNFHGKYLKDRIYSWIVLKKLIFGYRGINSVEIDKQFMKENLMLIAVQNQPFIGKRFFLAPQAKNDDGLFEVCGLEKLSSAFASLRMLHKVKKGDYLETNNAFQIKTDKISLKLDKTYPFMGDGEILCMSQQFKIKIIPKAITIFIEPAQP